MYKETSTGVHGRPTKFVIQPFMTNSFCPLSILLTIRKTV